MLIHANMHFVIKQIHILFLLVILSFTSVAATTELPIITEIKQNTSSPIEAISQAQKALLMAKNTGEKQYEGELLKFIGSSYQILSEYDSALYYYNESKSFAELEKNKDLLSANLSNIGIIFQNQGQNKKALEVSLQALQIDKELQNTDNIISSLNMVAASYEKLGMYDKALDYQLQSVELCTKYNKNKALANAHFILANIYSKNGKQQQAKDYYFLAKKAYNNLFINDSTSFSILQASSEIDFAIGTLYMNLEQYDTAFVYITNAVSNKKRIDDKLGLSKCLLQLGNISFQQNNLDQALQYNFNALQYKLLLNDNDGKALIYSNIGKIKMRMGKLQEAITFIHKSNAIAESIAANFTLKENYQMLSQLYAKQTKFAEALEYKNKFIRVLDTIHKINGQRAVEEMSIRFETEKIEQQNKLLQKDNDLKQVTIKKQQLINYMLMGIAVLVFVIFVILFVQFRAKKRANELMQLKNEQLNKQKSKIQLQKSKIEEVNKDLTDSIHYAKRIQESMLGQPESVLNELADYFIYFKPKDIVSGDFYWAGKKDGKIILSAIDCTGHGVPGAFMSMLGDSYLNQIVYNYNITSPDEILNALNKEIREALNQEATQNQDGMDMVICTIDLEAKVVEFAMAKNPMIYIKNGELFKVRGENQPIGGGGYEHKPFTKHTLPIDSPVSFYMFSDGYQDQFGGPKNKKFMIKRMQTLLLENHNRPMFEQKQIMDNALCEWMENTEQIDDVVLIGFKIE